MIACGEEWVNASMVLKKTTRNSENGDMRLLNIRVTAGMFL